MISGNHLDENQKNFGVLIVDDTKNICNMLKQFFIASGFSEVIVAYDGSQAKDILASTEDKIYVLILDLIMPQMGGLSLMRYLANNHPYHVGIVLSTGYANPENEKEFFKSGSDKVIPISFHAKPNKLSDLKNDVLKAVQQIQFKRNRANLFRSDDKSVAEDIKKALNRCKERKIVSTSKESDLSATLNEIMICFSNKCYMAAIALAGKILEICLRKCITDCGVKCGDTWMIGDLLRKLKELTQNGKRPFYKLNNIARVINQYRISAVHSTNEGVIPSREEAIMVVYAMLKVMDQTIEGTNEQNRSCINSSQKSSPVPRTAIGSF